MSTRTDPSESVEPVTLTLSDEQVQTAISNGVHRDELRNYSHNYNIDREQTHIRGLKGEIGFAEYYGLETDLSTRVLGDDDDFKIIFNDSQLSVDVKTTKYFDDPWLKVRPEYVSKADLFVLAAVSEQTVKIIGYATQEDVLETSPTKRTGHRENHVLKSEHLRPLPKKDQIQSIQPEPTQFKFSPVAELLQPLVDSPPAPQDLTNWRTCIGEALLILQQPPGITKDQLHSILPSVLQQPPVDRQTAFMPNNDVYIRRLQSQQFTDETILKAGLATTPSLDHFANCRGYSSVNTDTLNEYIDIQIESCGCSASIPETIDALKFHLQQTNTDHCAEEFPVDRLIKFVSTTNEDLTRLWSNRAIIPTYSPSGSITGLLGIATAETPEVKSVHKTATGDFSVSLQKTESQSLDSIPSTRSSADQVYGLHTIQTGEPAILTERIEDALALTAHNYRVLSFGTVNPNDAQFQSLNQMMPEPDPIVVVNQRTSDNTAIHRSVKQAVQLQNMGYQTFVAQLPAHTPNHQTTISDILQSEGETQLLKYIRQAKVPQEHPAFSETRFAIRNSTNDHYQDNDAQPLNQKTQG